MYYAGSKLVSLSSYWGIFTLDQIMPLNTFALVLVKIKQKKHLQTLQMSIFLSYNSAIYTVINVTDIELNRPAICGYSCHYWTITVQKKGFSGQSIFPVLLYSDLTLYSRVWYFIQYHVCVRYRQENKCETKQLMRKSPSTIFTIFASLRFCQLCRDSKEARKGKTSSEWTFLNRERRVDWLHPLLYMLSSLINS